MELKTPDDHLMFYFEDKRFDNVRAKITTSDLEENGGNALVGAENIIEFSKSMKFFGCISPTLFQVPDPEDTILGTLRPECQPSGRTKSDVSRKGDQDDLLPLLSRTLFDSMSPVVPNLGQGWGRGWGRGRGRGQASDALARAALSRPRAKVGEGAAMLGGGGQQRLQRSACP